jgi:hypothetical protein
MLQRKTSERTNQRGFVNQVATDAFLAMPLCLLLFQRETFLRDFSTFLMVSSEAFPAKTQVISLP